MSKGRRGGAKRRLRLQNDSPLAQHPLRVRPHPVSRLGMLPFRGTVFQTGAPAGGEITVAEAGVKNHGTTHGDNSQTLERGVTRGHKGGTSLFQHHSPLSQFAMCLLHWQV